MKNTQFTRQERFAIIWLQFLLFFSVLAGILFASYPHSFFQYLNNIGLIFFDFRSPTFGAIPFDLWWIFSLSLMLILIYITFQAQRDWLRYCQLVVIIILAKGSSFLGLLGLFFLTPPHFFYLVGAIVEGVLFLTTAYVYAKAIHSRNFQAN